MRDFLLDTQIVAYWYDTKRGEHPAVIGNIARLSRLAKGQVHTPRLLVSVITLGEIEYGNRTLGGGASTAAEERLRFLDEQLPESLEVTRDAVEAYGELRARLFDKYAPKEKRKNGMRPEQLIEPATSLCLQIQENDLWLCAQAVAHGLVLVTNDAMAPIRDVATGMSAPLFLQNWTDPQSVALSG